ncbi:MAG: hypothetical protein U1D55_06405 [Phycisphaerae bacterium]
MEKPSVSAGDWIRVGVRDAIVCNVHNEPDCLPRRDLEVVYLDDRNRATNNDVVWSGSTWEFVDNGDYGGYTDNSRRLAHFVANLRAPRRR